jgi:hypothetical protein
MDRARFRESREDAGKLLHEMTEEIMRAIQREVAVIRDEEPPADFFRRPAGAGARAKDARR